MDGQRSDAVAYCQGRLFVTNLYDLSDANASASTRMRKFQRGKQCLSITPVISDQASH